MTTLRLNPSKTYLTGFAHHHSHAEWETLGQTIDGSLPSSLSLSDTVDEEEEEPILATAKSLLGPQLWSEVLDWGGFVRPAYDGMRVVCSSNTSGGSELAREEDEDPELGVSVDLAKLGRELEFGGRRSRTSSGVKEGRETVAVGGEVGHAGKRGCDCP